MNQIINGVNVAFENVNWQIFSAGEDWRKVVLDAFEEGAGKARMSSVFKGKAGSAVGSVTTSVKGVPLGAIFAIWCDKHKIPYAMFVTSESMIAISDGVPVIERYIDDGTSTVDLATSALAVSFPNGCIIYGDNHMSQNNALTIEEMLKDISPSELKSVQFQLSKSYTQFIVIGLLIMAVYFGYGYYEKQQKEAALAAARLQQQLEESKRNPVQEYINSENQAVKDITPKHCDGKRFQGYAEQALLIAETNMDGWIWKKTTITCNSIVSDYVRTSGTNQSMREHIAKSSNLKVDFASDMKNAKVTMILNGMDQNIIPDDYSVDAVAMDGTEFFFKYGSEVQHISDNVNVQFTLSEPSPLITEDAPPGSRIIKKASFNTIGDGIHWSAIMSRFYAKKNFLVSSMTIWPEEKGGIKFNIEGVYFVY